MKQKKIIVLDKEITISKDNLISLTDMLKAKDGDFFISDWLRNRNTLEYLRQVAFYIKPYSDLSPEKCNFPIKVSPEKCNSTS